MAPARIVQNRRSGYPGQGVPGPRPAGWRQPVTMAPVTMAIAARDLDFAGGDHQFQKQYGLLEWSGPLGAIGALGEQAYRTSRTSCFPADRIGAKMIEDAGRQPVLRGIDIACPAASQTVQTSDHDQTGLA